MSKGPWNVLFFVILVFFGSFYLINLMLAVVTLSYDEESVNVQNEEEVSFLNKDLSKAQSSICYQCNEQELFVANAWPVITTARTRKNTSQNTPKNAVI